MSDKLIVRVALLATTALACHSGSALAQATPPAVALADDAGIQDIVVTAQRRSENVQKSSVAIQVLDTAAVQRAGVSTVGSLNSLVPGIKVSAIGSTVAVFLRGVGDPSTNALGNPAVSVNVDGVYVGRPTTVASNFFDIARIEVLKGPQGTLYGRNASGGALNIITTMPKIGVAEGFAEAEIGNYDLKRLTGAVNAPLGDKLAVRAAFQVVDRDGYLSDGSDDQKTEAVRLRALWEPSPDVSLVLNFDAGHDGGRGSGAVILPLVDRDDPWTSTNSPKALPVLANPIADIIQGVSHQDNEFINASAELTWDLGPATLTIIPAYRHTREDFNTWNGFFYSQMNDADQKSLEARVSNNGERLKWVLGGYYFEEDQDVRAAVAGSSLFLNSRLNYVPKTKAYAAFGEATFSLTRSLRVIGGLRYTSDRKTISGDNTDFSILFGDPVNGRLSETFDGVQKSRKVTWKAGAEYDLGPSNMLFATAATGFKSGGLNPSVSPNAYRPEVLTAYTIGSRNRFFDNRLQVNLELFYWDYKDKQESAIGFDAAGNNVFLTNNAASATLKGVSLDIVAKPTSNDTLSLFAEYNDANYDTFIYNIPTPFFSPLNTGCLFTPGPVNAAIDCSGRPLTRAPRLIGSAGYLHRFDLASGAAVNASVDAQYSGGYWQAADFTPNERTSSYATVNASLTFESASKNWSLTGFIRNITDEPVYISANQLPLQGPAAAVAIGAPRTFGGRLRFAF